MPCDITFWGRPENEQEVIQRMRRRGYILRLFREPIPSKSGASTPGNSGAVMSIGRPPSIKISQDQVLHASVRLTPHVPVELKLQHPPPPPPGI